jgi:2-oxoglutarate dehydrogenase E2 component (dihydrolipoamide succinyltransferase)
VPFNRIRARTGEHLTRSLATAAHAVTAVEVNYANVDRVRAGARDVWQANEGAPLTYLPFITRAVADTLPAYPHLNSSVADGGLHLHPAINIAIAVDLNFDGLVAPVIADADGLRVRGLARAIAALADKARGGELRPDDLSGGTFTITNSGSYDTRMVIPIINQPQVAILSTDGIARRPVVTTTTDGTEGLAIAPTGLLTMSWDHRAIDGAYAAAFLNDVRHMLQTHDWSSEL